MLLIETTNLYGRLLHAVLAQHREREVRDAAMEATVAMIAHELKQPLTAIVMNARAVALNSSAIVRYIVEEVRIA